MTKHGNEYMLSQIDPDGKMKEENDHIHKWQKQDIFILTPEETVLYIIHELSTAGKYCNAHFIPQHSRCPFCVHNFNVYSKLEESPLDMSYFLQKYVLQFKVPNCHHCHCLQN